MTYFFKQSIYASNIDLIENGFRRSLAISIGVKQVGWLQIYSMKLTFKVLIANRRSLKSSIRHINVYHPYQACYTVGTKLRLSMGGVMSLGPPNPIPSMLKLY